VDAVMPETEAGFNTDIAVKELLDLLVRKRVLKQKEVISYLNQQKPTLTKFQEPDIT